MHFTSQRLHAASTHASRSPVHCQAHNIPHPTRRVALSHMVAIPLALSMLSRAPAQAAAVTEVDHPRTLAEGGSASVIPALTADQYVSRIVLNKERAFDSIRASIDKSKYKDLSDNLSIDPFDTLFQSAVYLPWALLKIDPEAAERCYTASNVFTSNVKVLDRLLVAAQRNQVDEETVLAALDKVIASLDEVVLTATSR